jgi:hypothetical protein
MPIMPPPVEKPRASNKLENDLHPATITFAKPVMDPATGTFMVNENAKTMIDFRFQLDELDDEGNPIVLFRNKMSVSYGQYAGKWSDYAQLIEAALGIEAGNKAQHNIDTDEFLNKRVRVQTAKVPAKDGSGKVYTNAVGYFAPKRPAQAKAVPRINTELVREAIAADPKGAAAKLGLEEADLQDLPF